MRHWAYDTVWWQPSKQPMPIDGLDPRLNISPQWIWRAKNYINADYDCPDWNGMTNVLVAPAEGQGQTASGVTHFRAAHLVIGLAELFVEYGCMFTAKAIYEQWLTRDIILSKSQNRGQSQKYPKREPRWPER